MKIKRREVWNMRLRNCYENGEGVEKDIHEAVKWYRKAAEKGSISAKEALQNLEY